jgi:hypothetical protein
LCDHDGASTIAIKKGAGPPEKEKRCAEKSIVNLFVCPPALYISSCGLSQREVEKALQQRGSFHRPMIMCNAMQSHSAHHRITAPTGCTCDQQCNNCYTRHQPNTPMHPPFFLSLRLRFIRAMFEYKFGFKKKKIFLHFLGAMRASVLREFNRSLH